MPEYSTVYSDRHGSERTVIENDGHELRMLVRGVEFRGRMLDDFEPVDTADEEQLNSFCLLDNQLCDCTIEYDVPLPIVIQGKELEANLHVKLLLGEPRRDGRGGIDKEELLLELTYDNHSFASSGRSGLFEDELLNIQLHLPKDTYLKACITCGLSDYSPAGQSIFGGLVCFRDEKEAYRAVSSKADLFRVWGKRTECVQETYLCPEFERRRPGTGYRG